MLTKRHSKNYPTYKVDDLPEKCFVGCFIAGLKDDIRLDVQVKQPKALSKMISVAHLIEEWNQFQPKPGNQIRPAVPSYQSRPQQSTTMGLLRPSPSQWSPQATGILNGHDSRDTRLGRDMKRDYFSIMMKSTCRDIIVRERRCLWWLMYS